MRILVVGSGGREHAICYALNQSLKVTQLLATPGNAGIAEIAECIPFDPSISEIAHIVRLAKERTVDYVVIGPEFYLERGLANYLRERGIPVVGPNREAAMLETSKVFAKRFMIKYGIPTAPFRVFRGTATGVEAGRIWAHRNIPCVVKVNGLAAGKGVSVCKNPGEVDTAIRLIGQKSFGDAANFFLVEQYLEGKEASFFVLADGNHFVVLGEARDYKRLGDDDEGPNTGGMGAYSPCVNLPREEIIEKIVLPTFEGLRQEGLVYTGFLYFGLMITESGPMVLEYNARLGDPEAQAILPLLEVDLAKLLRDAATGMLVPSESVRSVSRKAVGVVLATASYPFGKDAPVSVQGLEALRNQQNLLVFHSGTARSPEPRVPLTRGGRILTVVGFGNEFREAANIAYDGIKMLRFVGMQYRSDIARECHGRT